MELRKSILMIIVAGLVAQSVRPAVAYAGSVGAESGVTKLAQQCGPVLKMTSDETDKLLLLNAKLSHLDGTYGTPKFDSQLKVITDEYFPKTEKIGSVTPTFFKRLDNRVAQERLRNLIAKTIGLDAREWRSFEGQMKSITLFNAGGSRKNDPLDKASTRLIQAVQEASQKASEQKKETLIFEEAYVSVAEMYAQLMEIRSINGEIIDADFGKYKTVIAAAVFAGASRVVIGTIQYGGKIVDLSGNVLRRVSQNPVVASRLAVLGQILGGAAVGAVGAPAVHTVKDSYVTVATAWRESLNNGTTYGCELNKQMALWSQNATHNTLHAMQIGASFGAGGGPLMLTARSARWVLQATWGAILTAQSYYLAKAGIKSYDALQYFMYAREASRNNDSELADKLLRQARASAQDAGDAVLDSVITYTLTYHVGHHRKEAMEHGAEEIRKLYATSADTIPTAYNALVETAQTTWRFAGPYFRQTLK